MVHHWGNKVLKEGAYSLKLNLLNKMLTELDQVYKVQGFELLKYIQVF